MKATRRWMAGLAAGLGLAMVVAVAPASAGDEPPVVSDGGPRTAQVWSGADLAGASRPAGGVSLIDTTSKSAVASAYLNRLVPAQRIKPNWTGSVGGCKPGTESLASRTATVTAINFFRSMAGLGPVTRNESYEDEALKSALMMDANNRLSHFVSSSGGFQADFSWLCSTLVGMQAAYSSNLALGISGAESIEGYMDEPGNNSAVGHRRWFLYAPLRKVGVGSTSDANTVRVIERPGASGLWGTPLVKPNWVSWPNKGFIPWELMPTEGNAKVLHRWSLGSPRFPRADFSAAKVSMSLNGTPLAVKLEPYQPYYADNTLVWSATRRSGAAFPMNTDSAIKVVVTGIKGGPSSRYEFTVRPFPLGPPTAPDAKQPDLEGKAFVARWGSARPNGTPVTAYVAKLYRFNGVGYDEAATKRVGSSTFSARFEGLTSGKQYCYEVAADSKAGLGAFAHPTYNCWTIPY